MRARWRAIAVHPRLREGWRRWLLGAILSAAFTGGAQQPAGAAESAVALLVDEDDDDRNGQADHLDPKLAAGGAAAIDLVALAPRGSKLPGGAPVSIVPLGRGKASAGRYLAHRPGRVELTAGGATLQLNSYRLRLLDADTKVIDPLTSHGAISRSVPGELTGKADPERMRWLLVGPSGSLPAALEVKSLQATTSRATLDSQRWTLTSRPCPAGLAEPELECAVTSEFRLVPEAADRSHPAVRGQVLLAEVGGTVEASFPALSGAAYGVPVGGPRSSKIGPLPRFEAKLRVHVVRAAPGGAVPIGADAEGATDLVRQQVRDASQIWGQCGIRLSQDDALEIRVVDPPIAGLLSLGCGGGLPASGGEIRFRAGNKKLRVRTTIGQTPEAVARVVASSLTKAGFRPEVSPNASTSQGANPSVDILVRDSRGRPVVLSADRGGLLDSDPSLQVCLAQVALADGLSHFSDFDSAQGTLEERALIKWLEDGDPTTLDVFVVSNFAATGRIGESFIYAEGSSMRNLIVLDRAGLRAGSRSKTLAHELGHILLSMPGHPDDFGVDQPSRLMDADAADASVFGPRRLELAECERAIRQSGPGSVVPLLTRRPLRRRKSGQTR